MAGSDEVKGSDRIPVVLISGPTGSGKSSLAIEMASRFEAEIISADSRQIYRQMKIGTDRLDEKQQKGITHHLMGTVDLGQRFTVFDFVSQAHEIIERIVARGRRVIVCGGTGLYLRALVDGIYEIPDEDLSYRNDLLDMVAAHGHEYVYRMLTQIDPDAAAELHPHNLVRVIRALEMYHITGKRKNERAELPTTKNERLSFLYVILMPERSRLYRRIEQRVDEMIAEGLVDEVKGLAQSEFGEPLRQSKVVGYREVLSYLDGESSLDEAIALIKQNTRRYAKRQYTWFRAVKEAETIEAFGADAAAKCAQLIQSFCV
jgi:tRNA dimethylallyltransferase